MKISEKYNKEVAKELMSELNIKNVNAVPKIKKISINVGIGTYLAGGKDYSQVLENISLIAGQKPVVKKAKKAVSNFKLRIGMPVGISVTLRGAKMDDFLTKFVNVVLPRVRDFRGISGKSFDKEGNYSVGMKEYTVFPEVNPDDVVKLHGLQINIETTAKNQYEGYLLLKKLGFPFKDEVKKPSPAKK
ncbi:MAG: 50S ribosomal protein L5 [Candidatus Peregrinibacteria bacterium]|nr:50S ribosomal protein L5 [Candidatus Peregrinibacteria bacterium]MDZ4245419.1 50S ribosomal protein L5 [Candidatus Gracilibacteria bacterium]